MVVEGGGGRGGGNGTHSVLSPARVDQLAGSVPVRRLSCSVREIRVLATVGKTALSTLLFMGPSSRSATSPFIRVSRLHLYAPACSAWR